MKQGPREATGTSYVPTLGLLRQNSNTTKAPRTPVAPGSTENNRRMNSMSRINSSDSEYVTRYELSKLNPPIKPQQVRFDYPIKELLFEYSLDLVAKLQLACMLIDGYTQRKMAEEFGRRGTRYPIGQMSVDEGSAYLHELRLRSLRNLAEGYRLLAAKWRVRRTPEETEADAAYAENEAERGRLKQEMGAYYGNLVEAVAPVDRHEALQRALSYLYDQWRSEEEYRKNAHTYAPPQLPSTNQEFDVVASASTPVKSPPLPKSHSRVLSAWRDAEHAYTTAILNTKVCRCNMDDQRRLIHEVESGRHTITLPFGDKTDMDACIEYARKALGDGRHNAWETPYGSYPGDRIQMRYTVETCQPWDNENPPSYELTIQFDGSSARRSDEAYRAASAAEDADYYATPKYGPGSLRSPSQMTS